MDMSQLVHFFKDFDFTAFGDPYITIAYKAGHYVEVSDECAAKAVLAGCALVEEGLYARDSEDDQDDQDDVEDDVDGDE